MLVDAMKSKGIEPEEVRFIMKDAVGGASGGTLASVFNILESSTNEELVAGSNPFFLAPRDPVTGQPIEATDKAVVNMNRDSFSFLYDKEEQCWESPYVMQSIDTRVVNRSNALSGWKYGRNLIYREFTAASNIFVALLSTMVFPLVGLLLYIPWTRMLIKKMVPQPGQGPSQDLLDNGFFKAALGGKGKRKHTNSNLINPKQL